MVTLSEMVEFSKVKDGEEVVYKALPLAAVLLKILSYTF